MNVLLLTATIRPKQGQPDLLVLDENERFREYCRAFEFYDELLTRGVVDRIVFAENSDFELRTLAARFASDRIEWIGCYDLDYPSTKHRGYGEFRLIDLAWSRSQTLRTVTDKDMVWKVTGRYIVNNLVSFLRRVPSRVDVYADVHGEWMSMEIFGCSRRGYDKVIRGVCEQFVVGLPPEITMAAIVQAAASVDCNVESSFHWPVDIVGRRGSDGSRFRGRLGPLRHAFRVARSMTLLPFRRLRLLRASHGQ